MDFAPGIYPADTDYESIDAINISRLLLAAISPKHYKRGSKRDTKPMAFGRAGHCATLEPKRFESDFEIWETTYRGGEKVGKVIKAEGDRRPRSGNAWDVFETEAAVRGHSIVTDTEWQEARAIAEVVRTDEVAGPIVRRVQAEQVMVWRIDGVLCKGRPDGISDLEIPDLKICADITEHAFSRSVARYSYHVRMAWYVDGYEAITGKRLPANLIAVEAAEPHDVVVYDLPDEVLDIGREEYHRLLGIVRECQRSGEWPGIGNRCRNILSLPRYLYPDGEEDTEETHAAAE